MCDLCVYYETGFYGRIAPRSGLSCKCIDIGAGVIDSDFKLPIKILLINNSGQDFKINKGDRIAQLIVEKIFVGDSVEISEEMFKQA